MNLKPKLTYLLFGVFTALIAGVINYYFFRPDIILFDWLSIKNNSPKVFNNLFVYYFFRGYFSDIAWCISLCLTIIILKRKYTLFKFDKFLLLSIPYLTEIAQYFSLIQGSFDWIDLLLYTVIILLVNIVFSPIIPFNMQKAKSAVLSSVVFVLFFIMALACASSKPPVNKVAEQPLVTVKDAEEASIKTDQANIDFSVEVNKKYDLSQAWKLTTQIVTDYFDDIEVSDRETSYLRTAWSVRSFRQATIRTRLIIKLGNSDPLTFKIKLVSEYSRIPSASVKSDEQFVEWDRILRRYQNVIGDFSARLGNK